MAGLNFQTQTIINSNLDLNSSNLNGNGVDNTWLFKAVTTKIDGKEKKVFKVKRDFVFVAENVKELRKAEAHEAEVCRAVIDFSKINEIKPTSSEPKKYCRLDLYLGVEGAEPFIYSNPWVQKGIPFWVEFTVTSANQSKIAETVADAIKKNKLFLVDKDLITVSATGNQLTLTGATEYQRFRNIEVCTFSATSDYNEVVAQMVKANSEDYENAAIKEMVYGKNGFGTYSHLTKDLRLPTAENTQWTHVRQSETPVIGALYHQYIIEYCAPATNEGLQFVGQRGESYTTHVFWVNQDVVADWDAELVTAGLATASTAVSEELDA